MDKFSKGDFAIFWGSYIAGGTASIPLLWTGSADDWLFTGLKYLGVLAAALGTAFCGVLGKHFAEKMLKKKTNDKETTDINKVA
jgi:hypothetical protein